MKRAASGYAESAGESATDALNTALEIEPRDFSGVGTPIGVQGWCGTTHVTCPIKDVEGSKNGYGSYICATAYTFERIDSWLHARAFDVRAFAFAKKPEDPGPGADVLDEAVFSSGASGIHEGKNWMARVRVTDAENTNFTIGETDTIPLITGSPASEFDEDGWPRVLHSVKRGYTADVWLFLDYGVEGGFNFR